MTVINSFFNSILFWSAWIIIPVIMEIIPALGSVWVLFKKKRTHKEYEMPKFAPEISIIIPVYNSADTLEECLKSIYDSTYPNEAMRIYLVNNEGTDDSFKVFADCQKKYPELLIQWMNAKQGKSKALNLALFNSEGKYIIHIDSDGLLEPHALTNMVKRFEAEEDLQCVTGAILTDPKQIDKYKVGLPRLFRKMEFMEYAQAFLAGRNYAAEHNDMYTLSGAFSAFRKDAVLKSQLYNSDTLAEDTQITFQMKYLQGMKVGICEDAIFFVDPIEDFNKLYTQRQRWQRGSLEVSTLFLKEDMNPAKAFKDENIRTLMYDHTFAFPRMIWYLALICLLAVNYAANVIIFATLFIFFLYILLGYFYYISTVGFLHDFPEIKKYYRKQWYVVPLLPFFNFVVFFIRFAGVINSINTQSSWRTRNLTDERKAFESVIVEEWTPIVDRYLRIKNYVNGEENES